MQVIHRHLASWSLICLLSTASLAYAADDLRLVEAAKRQDPHTVRSLLKQKVNVNTTQPDGATALHWAVQRDDIDMVDLLIDAGADVSAANVFGVTPLSLACVNGSAAVIERLLDAGADPHSPFAGGETALMTAARTGKADAVRALLNRGVNVNAAEPSHGQTALMWAAAQGHIDIVRVLLEDGADVRARSKAGFTPLMFAARTGDLGLVRVLLGAGATVNEAAADGTTPLVLATVRSHLTLARFLIEQGADPNKGPGFTPLHWAAKISREPGSRDDEWSAFDGLRGPARFEFVHLLLQHGADPNARAEGEPGRYGGRARGGTGVTPFLMAAKAGDVAMMRLLVAAGADPLVTTKAQTTALMMAAGVVGRTFPPEQDALEAVKLCVELGSDVNAADRDGETALHGATYRGIGGSASVIQFLVSKGARLNVTDVFGWTPLAIAEGIYYGSSDTRNDATAELLRKLGAAPTPPDVEREVQVVMVKAGRTDDAP